MIYVYRRAASDGARELVEEILLQGQRARRTQGGALRNLTNGDILVCWGDYLQIVPAGVTAINNVPGINKFEEAQRLAAAGVRTIEVSRTRPAATRVAARAPFAPNTYRVDAANLTTGQAASLQGELTRFMHQETERRRLYDAQPAPVVQSEWIARSNNHVGGRDLLAGRTAGDYFSKKENLTEEYRVHMFDGRSIRAGVKRQERFRPDGVTASHPWIRSFDAGWKIHYEGFRSTEAMRLIADQAVRALGLTFGAVDIGLRSDGSLIVLEVNRAPGIEGGTATSYATKVIAYANGERGEARAARPARRNR